MTLRNTNDNITANKNIFMEQQQQLQVEVQTFFKGFRHFHESFHANICNIRRRVLSNWREYELFESKFALVPYFCANTFLLTPQNIRYKVIRFKQIDVPRRRTVLTKNSTDSGYFFKKRNLNFYSLHFLTTAKTP